MTMPLRHAWLGETQGRKLIEKIEYSLQSWSEKWAPTLDNQPVQAGFVVSILASNQLPEQIRWYRVDDEAAMIGWIGTTRAELGRMVAFLSGAPAEDDLPPGDPSILEGVAMRPISEMLALAFGRDIAIAPQSDPPEAGNIARLTACYVGLLIRCPYFKAQAWLLPDAVDRLVGAPKLAAPQRQRRLVAVGAAVDPKLAITVSLDVSGRTEFRDIADLRPGQVVLLDRGLSAPWHINASNGRVLGEGILGRSGRHFAVQIVSGNAH
jgi:hypothetical protein